MGSKRDDIIFQIWDNNGQLTTAKQQTAEAIVQQWKKYALKKNAKLEPPLRRRNLNPSQSKQGIS